MTDEKTDAISQRLRRGDLRRAERPFPAGGMADRLRHPVQHERQRGHCQPRQSDCRARSCCHPNDDMNMSQSSNDTFPTAMHISAVIAIEDKLLPGHRPCWWPPSSSLEAENEGIVKSGRTHLQDATPIKFSQEISGWRASLERDAELLKLAVHSR